MPFQPEYGTILYEVQDGIALLTMNREERLNAFNGEMHADLKSCWIETNRDDDVKVVVITGKGRGFATGADMKEESSGQQAGSGGADRRAPMLDWIGNFQNKKFPGLSEFGLPDRAAAEPAKPFIAAVNGICCGGGLHFLDNSDFAIAAESATFFDPHVNVAIAACGETFGMIRFRNLPRGIALRIAFMGLHYRLDAKRAYELGLITEVVPDAQLMPRALELAAKVASNGDLAVRATCAAVWDTWSMTYDESRFWAEAYANQVRQSPEARTLVHAAAKRRLPQWAGR